MVILEYIKIKPISVTAPGFDCTNYAITTVWHSATLSKEETTAETIGDLTIASQQPGDLERKVSAQPQGQFLSMLQLLSVSKDFEISGVSETLITRSRNPFRLSQIMWKLIITEDTQDTSKAQEVISLASLDLRSHRTQDWASASFSLLSSQSFSPSSLPFLCSLDTAPHSTTRGRCSPSQLPFYKILILAFSSLPEIQLPLLPPPLLPHPPENIRFPHKKQDPSLTSTRIWQEECSVQTLNGRQVVEEVRTRHSSHQKKDKTGRKVRTG